MAEEEEPQGFTERGDSTVRTLRFYDAIIWRLKDLMGNKSGLDGLSRFAMTVDLTKKRQPELIQLRERLQTAYSKYTILIDHMDPKKYKELTKRQFEEIIVDTISASFPSSSMRESRHMASNRFREISLMLRDMGVMDVDALCVGAWYGIAEALTDGFVAAYKILQLCMRSVCEIYGRPRFPLTYEDYKSSFLQLHYEVTAGDKSSSIDEKIMTQMMVYAAYNDVDIDQDLGGVSMRKLFHSGAEALCFGYLLDNGRPGVSSLWQNTHKEFDLTISKCREPLFRTFYEDVVVYQRPRLTWTRIDGDYEYAFQMINPSKWTAGDLTGTIEETPFKFEFMPKPRYPAISSILGAPGCLSGDTSIVTDNGPATLESIANRPYVWVLSQTETGPKFIIAFPQRTGRQLLYEITTSNGSVLATKEHRFLTRLGWKKVGELSHGDEIYTIHEPSNIKILPEVWQTINNNKTKEILFNSLCRQISRSLEKTTRPSMPWMWKILSPSPKFGHKSSQVLLSKVFRKRKSPESGNTMHWMPEEIFSSTFRCSKILLPIMQYEIQESNEQLYETARSSRKSQQVIKRIFCKTAKRRRFKTLWQRMEEPSPRLWYNMDENSQKRGFTHTERIFQNPSRETREQLFASEQDDFIRARNQECSGFTRASLELEQDDSCGGPLSFSRFSNQRKPIPDRMQWGLLASGQNEGPKESSEYGASRVPCNSSQRENYQVRVEGHLDTAVVYSVKKYGEDFTFDLYVPGTNNYFLTNGLLSHNSGKSTLLGALSALLITKGKGFDFIALSDNSNWPMYAFMPQMPVPGNGAYRFNNRLGIRPRAVPILILNIVKDLSELSGESLTRYDRIVKVKGSRSFHIEMSTILDELARIAEEFGMSGSTGLVAARNLMRRGTDEKSGKRYDTEVQNAVSLLDSFNSWRRNHTKQPCGLTIDEVKESGLGMVRSREQSQLADLIESAVISARRYNFSMKFAGHVTRDMSDKARELTINTFWKDLPIERAEARSPLDILLDSLPLEESEQAEAVRRLYNSKSFGKTRLMFWHSKLKKEINVVQPMPAPFQPHIVGKDPIEIYNFYLKSNPKIDREQFFRRSADLKFDFLADGSDEQEGEEEGETW